MKKIKRFSKITLAAFTLLAIVVSCVDDSYDKPDVPQIPVGTVYTIQEIKDFFNSNGGTYTFTEDASVYATVTMDNETDNSYKTFYIQDHTAAIAVFQNPSGGVYIGDSVRIYLKDLVVMKYSELFQINSIAGDGINVETNVIKQAANKPRTPEEVNIKDILDNKANYQCKLVKLPKVQFIESGVTFADPTTNPPTNVNLHVQDSTAKEILVRTSGYATFAGVDIPSGSGSMIAIVGQYNNDMQLVIRRTSELEMTGERFVPNPVSGVDPVTSFNVNFESLSDYDAVAVDGWQNLAGTGESRTWQARLYSGNMYAQGSAFKSTDAENNEWLITPPIDFDQNANEVLHFRSAVAFYTHEAFELLISFDYNGLNYETATWQPISGATIAGSSTPSNTWVNSGDIDLSGYTGIGFIAFKYYGDADQGLTGTFRIDDIVLENKP